MCGETKGEVRPLLVVEFSLEELVDGQRFTGTSWTNHENMLVVGDKGLEDLGKSD